MLLPCQLDESMLRGFVRQMAHRSLRGPCGLAHEIGTRRTSKVTDFAPLQPQSTEPLHGAPAVLRRLTRIDRSAGRCASRTASSGSCRMVSRVSFSPGYPIAASPCNLPEYPKQRVGLCKRHHCAYASFTSRQHDERPGHLVRSCGKSLQNDDGTASAKH